MESCNTRDDGAPHIVSRDDLLKSVEKLYSNDCTELLNEYPFCVEFKGEKKRGGNGS